MDVEGSVAESTALGLFSDLSTTEKEVLLRAAEFGSLAFEMSPGPRVQHEDEVSQASGTQEVGSLTRLASTNWCQCGSCITMPTEVECLCCKELGSTAEELQYDCITIHEDFKLLCLNTTVLEVAYFELPGQHEPMSAHIHKRYRYTAYRQFARWVWQKLGKNKRMVIPACAVNRIREAFRTETTTGFKYPRY
ncbi:P2X purinoceptor 7-like [Ornithodoros turicata]|uniref:P2X purinoceptor 7-like n=1 Tax=Ornithodoros turicata TaxID=34597 RepID=UPI00313A4409